MEREGELIRHPLVGETTLSQEYVDTRTGGKAEMGEAASHHGA